MTRIAHSFSRLVSSRVCQVSIWVEVKKGTGEHLPPCQPNFLHCILPWGGSTLRGCKISTAPQSTLRQPDD